MDQQFQPSLIPASVEEEQPAASTRFARFVEGRPAAGRFTQRASQAYYGLQCSYWKDHGSSRRSTAKHRGLHENEPDAAVQRSKARKGQWDSSPRGSWSKSTEINHSTQSCERRFESLTSASPENVQTQSVDTASGTLSGDIQTEVTREELGHDEVLTTSDAETTGVGGVNAHTRAVDLIYSTDYPIMRNTRTTASGPGRDSQSNRYSTEQSRDVNRISRSPLHGASRSAGIATSDVVERSANNSTREDSGSSSDNNSSMEPGDLNSERIFIDVYSSNKHCIHPFLDEAVFRARCAKEIQDRNIHERSKQVRKSQSTFQGLYYAVVALGAINAGTDAISRLTSYYKNSRHHSAYILMKFALNDIEWASKQKLILQMPIHNTSTYESDPTNAFYGLNMQTGNQTWNDSFLMALNLEGPGPERANALANLFDFTNLEDFAIGQNMYAQTINSVDTSLDFPDLNLGGSDPEDGRTELQEMNSLKSLVNSLTSTTSYGLILIFDVREIVSFHFIEEIKEDIMRLREAQELHPFITLIGNKADIQENERQVSTNCAENLCRLVDRWTGITLAELLVITVYDWDAGSKSRFVNMPEPRQSVVPKFASFRPKPAKPTDVKKDESHRSHLKRKDDRWHKPQHRDDHQSLHSHRKEKLEADRIGDNLVEQDPHLQDESSRLYFIDRQGDVKNLVYGSVHQYDVPSFHRIGAGRILGLPIDWKIDRDYGDIKDIVITNSKHFKPYSRGKYIFSQVEKEKPQILRFRHELLPKESINLETDFIPLEETRGKKRKRPNDVSIMEGFSGSEDEQTHYRSILGKAKPMGRPVDDAFEYATESDLSDSEAGRIVGLDSSLQKISVQLARNVENHPEDVNAWQALIDHQDVLVSEGRENYRLTNAELTSTADIKIHLYEKALEKMKSLKDREALLLGLIIEGSKIWDVTEQANRWKKISQDNINSLLLWKSYLDFKLTNFSKFQFEDVRNIFVDRNNQLLESIKASALDIDDSLWQNIIYVLLRLTLFLRESGFSELAIAIWQGLLELNFFAPPQTLSPDERSTMFLEFWESEVPRVGEEGALGWCHFAATSDTSTVPNPEEDPADTSIEDHQIFQSWASAERQRSKVSRQPARTLDDVAEDDPFRVILFSDIEAFIIHIPPKEILQKSLLDAFLVFCHLSPTQTSPEEVSQNKLLDSLLAEELLNFDAKWLRHQYQQAIDRGENPDKDISSILTSLPANFSVSPSTMYSNNWFRCLWSWGDTYSEGNEPITYSFVQNALKQLTNSHFREDLAEYYLAFAWRNDPDKIRKLSKQLLKQHPTSLRLYNSYAMIEWSRGNKIVAVNTYTSILNMAKTLPENSKKDTIYLWVNWIWGCLEDGNNDAALRQLLSIPEGVPNDNTNLGPATLLKSKQHLTMNRDLLLSSGNLQPAIAYAECLALLEYLSAHSNKETQAVDQGDVASAMKIYTSFSETLIARKLGHTTAHELLLQSATRLLYHHAQKGPFRPSLLRHHLTTFLALFPSNTIFLSLYAHNESRLRIDNRVRTLLLTSTLTYENDTPSSRLFAIRYEMSSPTSTIHSTRAAFERAVASPVCRALPGLWRMYILWCTWTAMDWAQVKEVWFRAIRQCPWAKELYLLGFEMLDGKVSNGELREVYKVMVEKGLRVHIDLEEKFEEFGGYR
ncbi:hypothetical protein B7463_g4343, partial [Scytalidium lignicola]